ncbi:hypothetical protein J6590_028632 [Homalodisca vitripennis]|nr:hypothetical protein J6590_028632 [Homalodisca vitripennis]
MAPLGRIIAIKSGNEPCKRKFISAETDFDRPQDKKSGGECGSPPPPGEVAQVTAPQAHDYGTAMTRRCTVPLTDPEVTGSGGG